MCKRARGGTLNWAVPSLLRIHQRGSGQGRDCPLANLQSQSRPQTPLFVRPCQMETWVSQEEKRWNCSSRSSSLRLRLLTTRPRRHRIGGPGRYIHSYSECSKKFANTNPFLTFPNYFLEGVNFFPVSVFPRTPVSVRVLFGLAVRCEPSLDCRRLIRGEKPSSSSSSCVPTLYRETASLALKGGRREGDCQSGAKKRRESVGRRRRLPPKAEPAAEIPPPPLKKAQKGGGGT